MKCGLCQPGAITELNQYVSADRIMPSSCYTKRKRGTQEKRVGHRPPLELHAIQCGAASLNLLVEDVGRCLNERPSKLPAICEEWRTKDWNRCNLLVHVVFVF